MAAIQEQHVIIITGTKRSGTSMWMQILKEAGFTIMGEAFPKNWKNTIQDANPHGFYESPLRSGIYYATNPDPRTGEYLNPQQTRDVAIKVFIPGLCRSDLAFTKQVVGSVRHWREYASSIDRLHKMEDTAFHEQSEKRGMAFFPFPKLDPVLEWWLENFALIRDVVTRQYPAHLVTYQNVVEDPEQYLPPILRWLGAENVEAGVAAVSPETRTQKREQIERSHPHEDVFDEFYEIIHNGDKMTNAFLEKLNVTHQKLIPAIEADVRRVTEARFKQAKKSARRRRDALHPDTMESLIHTPDTRVRDLEALDSNTEDAGGEGASGED